MSEITEGILELEEIDLKSDEALSQIENIISNKLKKLPSFRVDLALNTFVIRARYLNDNTENFYCINDLSFNPNKSNIQIGRANYQNQQIFYAATNRITALTEIRFVNNLIGKNIAKYVFSKWEIIKPLQLVVIVDHETVQKHNALGLLGISDFIIQNAKDFKDNSEIADFLELYKYISKKFVEHVPAGQEFKYKITAAFSNFVYNRIPQCDGIVYQSVQYPEEFNVALKSNAIIDEKVKLHSAYRQKIRKISETDFQECESLISKSIDYNTFKIEW